MKTLTLAGLASLILLSGCMSWERPYISGEDGCDEIVDARERLDCYERAERAEDEWREELKRKEAEKDRDRED